MKGLAVGREDGRMAARHVEVVDAKIEGRADGFYNIRFLLRADDGRAHADDADFSPPWGSILYSICASKS